MSLNQRVLSSLSRKSNKNKYQQTDSDSSTLSPVLSAISDNKSLTLFTAIANGSNPASAADEQQQQPIAEMLISRMNMTRKQYYTRINLFREAGLIRRQGARFILTSLGKVVYETHKTIGFAIHNRWKLQAIDSLDTSRSTEGMPFEERHRLIKALIGDHEVIQDILLCQNDVNVKNDYLLAA
jgi:hypothetical protein